MPTDKTLQLAAAREKKEQRLREAARDRKREERKRDKEQRLAAAAATQAAMQDRGAEAGLLALAEAAAGVGDGLEVRAGREGR